jgi:hypothetical protein
MHINLDKLKGNAVATRDQKIAAANREFNEAMAHIEWVKAHVNGHARVSSSLFDTGRRSVSAVPTSSGTSLAAGVRQACSELRNFTAHGVVEWLEKKRPDLRPGQRRTQISCAIVRLRKEGVVQKIESARGSAPAYALTAIHEGNGNAAESADSEQRPAITPVCAVHNNRLTELRNFLLSTGPITRREILRRSGIPVGTVGSYLQRKHGFEKDDQSRWHVAEKLLEVKV